ncbi:MAG: UDP-N-acetylmuramoyl-tripeptide--D-alanyl-D-alanine ligase [Lachnospiraceae bacterium]
MEQMSLDKIASACGGTYYGNDASRLLEVSSVSIDSRKIEKNGLFIPIRGARVDGHKYIPQVMKAGALCTLSEKLLEGVAYSYILVDSCEQALKEIAAYYRSTLHIKVVGITGSVGKTSTREMIASVLEQKYKVLQTEGNYNNAIGLPLTIFKIKKEHEIAVLEMGISDFGEMEELAKIARPDICVITNIGYSHIEFLKSREGILKAKTEMFQYMNPEATIILNGDDDMLATVGKTKGVVPKFFGMKEGYSIYASSIHSLGLKGTSCLMHFPEESIEVTVSIPGIHMIYNALAGATVGLELSLTIDEIKQGIEALQLVEGRGNILEIGGLTIIDDCYNANPVSMKASLDTLSCSKGRKVAVLGDMGELGLEKKELHFEIGTYVVEKGIDCLYCIGELAKEYAAGAARASAAREQKSCTCMYFETKEEFKICMPKLISKGDTVLVKASHFMEFPVIVDALKQTEI